MTHAAFRSAVENGDSAGMVAALAPDVVFNSPIKHRPFEGREAVAVLFGALVETFEDFRYTDEFDASDGAKALVFRARVGDRDIEGIDILRFDDEGLIADFTVMVRPLTGATALAEEVGRKLGLVEARS
ncbi:MAG TPA: nuclear transport factor 2 family protein [Solirubrobacterales bacterium]|nr:nuclear transport factor 2 family protein [Solirubrobacterales bacterium]